MKFFCLIISLFFLFEELHSQALELSTISSAGGSIQTNDTRLTWTIGESFTDYKTGGNFKLQEGFHQGDLLIITGTVNLPDNIGITVFPNPAKEKVTVKILGINSAFWNLELYDNKGLLIYRSKSGDMLTDIDFSSLPASLYLLKIFDNKGNYKVFNIVKE
jgi:hypothetical protein